MIFPQELSHKQCGFLIFELVFNVMAKFWDKQLVNASACIKLVHYLEFRLESVLI